MIYYLLFIIYYLLFIIYYLLFIIIYLYCCCIDCIVVYSLFVVMIQIEMWKDFVIVNLESLVRYWNVEPTTSRVPFCFFYCYHYYFIFFSLVPFFELQYYFSWCSGSNAIPLFLHFFGVANRLYWRSANLLMFCASSKPRQTKFLDSLAANINGLLHLRNRSTPAFLWKFNKKVIFDVCLFRLGAFSTADRVLVSFVAYFISILLLGDAARLHKQNSFHFTFASLREFNQRYGMNVFICCSTLTSLMSS